MSEPTLSASGLTQTPETAETTNQAFLEAIFGRCNPAADVRPLLCAKHGDPDNKKAGWAPQPWGETRPENPDLNWYVQPSTFARIDGKWRAQKAAVVAVHAVMLDDVGTKVPLVRLTACPPSWLLETSPGNFQAGYIFSTPIDDAKQADALKEALIDADLCDSGASGGAARWMRLPVGINGKAKYVQSDGTPWRCHLSEWHPERRYSMDELIERLELTPPAPPGRPKRQKKSKVTGERLAELIDQSADTVHIPRAAENPVLAALAQRGLYKRPLGSGKHDMTCPWAHEHTDGIDHGSAYFEPTDLYPIGGFKCQHSHGDKKRMGALLEFLGVTPAQAKHKAVIRVSAGELDRVVDAAERELAASGRYYQRGNLIVRVLTDPGSQETRIKPLTGNALTRALSECANWERYDGRTGDFVPSDPPARHTSVLFDAEAYNHLPVLQGIARQPYLRADGSLMTEAGFDAASGMFGAFDVREFRVPQAPTKADAQRALAELNGLLSEFAFANATACSAALAAMLTAVVRPTLPVAPMFHALAPQIASGKTYLLSMVAALAGPGTVSAYAFPTKDEECSKLLLSALLEGPAVVMFDNLTSDLIPFKSLCSALTSEQLTDRILGVSKTATVNTRSLMLSSGNNVGPVGDMTRRTVTIALDPQCETPAARQFNGDPLAKVQSCRAHYVSLALTVVLAYLHAGAPAVAVDGKPLQPLGSYAQWTRLVRSPLVWLGQPDPAVPVFDRMADDPDRETLGRLLQAWHARFGKSATAVREVVAAVDAIVPDPELAEVVRDVSEERGVINRRRLGRWLARHQGRLVDGMKLVRASRISGSERWQVVMGVPAVSRSRPEESVHAQENAEVEA